MLVQIRIQLLGFIERGIECNFALRRDLLLGRRFLVCRELIVRELEDSDLSNLTIDLAAIRTCPTFPALLVDPFVDCCSADVI
jgi:hypothetical protein